MNGRLWCSLDVEYAGNWENCEVPLQCNFQTQCKFHCNEFFLEEVNFLSPFGAVECALSEFMLW